MLGIRFLERLHVADGNQVLSIVKDIGREIQVHRNAYRYLPCNCVFSSNTGPMA